MLKNKIYANILAINRGVGCMESIVKYLRIKLGAKIPVIKSSFSKYEYKYSENEYYKQFMEIINKTEYSIDDMNDLLLCYADHDLSLNEILELISSRETLYYDKGNFGCSFPLNEILLYFLLSSKNNEVIKGTLKLFSTNDLRLDRNFGFASYCGLNNFDTFYDIYTNLESVINCKDSVLRKRKAICLLYYLDEINIIDSLKNIGITLDDVENLIKEYENSGETLNSSFLGKLLQKVLILNDKSFGSGELFTKVKNEYKKYVSLHANFKMSDFVTYYNDTFDDDFSVFTYKKNEKILLNEKMLYLILSSFGYNIFKFNYAGYGEYIDEFKSLEWARDSLNRSFSDYVERDNSEYETRKIIIEKYGHLIEELKKPFNYTYNYFIYVNVLPEHRTAFKSFVAWHYVYAKIFDKDIRNSSKLQKDETFKVILEQCKAELTSNFMACNEIRNKYFEFIKEYVGDKYISAKRWKEQFNLIYEEQLALVSEKYFINFDKLIDTEEFSISSYLEVNHLPFSLAYAANVLKKFKPELGTIIDKVMNAYTKEQTLIREEKIRKEKEEKVLACSDIVSRFLEKDFKAKKDFLDYEGLTETQFDKILETVEQENFELYVKFMNKFNSLKSQRYALLMKTVETILAGLVNGVNENGIVRPFNFLDYCLLTKLPFDKFTILVVNSNKLDNTNIRQFRQFSRAVKSYSMVTNEYIFNERYIVNLNGVQHEVTYEEKTLALAYLRKYNMSNYYILYKLALQKVLKGQITRESLGIVPVQDEKQLNKKIS